MLCSFAKTCKKRGFDCFGILSWVCDFGPLVWFWWGWSC